MGGDKSQQHLAFYRMDTGDALKELGSSEDGLSSALAAERLVTNGPNQLKQLHRESLLHKYLKQYKDLMILLLLGSSIVAFATEDARTAIVILFLILFNTLIGFTQEHKAERLMESLEKLVVPEAKVKRDGRLLQVASTELVTGDIVYIEEGDSVPADLRLITETELATNDFAMTGESNPSRKFTHAIESEVELGNRHNLVFMGTTVAGGQAYGVVIGTGMQTELGRIASLSADTVSTPSPLQKEMNNIATRVTQGTVLLCAAVLPIAIHYGDLTLKNALLFAIGIASSIIPQGLPAEINTALAQAANKLAKAKALVKKLSAVETLGATNIICTDKTGTLTKNQMTVQNLMIGKTSYKVSGTGYENNGTINDAHGKKLSNEKVDGLSLFFTAGALASNARVSQPDSEHAVWYVLGDPTEGALITLAHKAGLDPEQLDQDSPELKEFAFDSARKRMSSIRRYGAHQQLYVFTKGAPESVLERCDDIWDHGHVRGLTASDRKSINKQHTEWAENASRNLAFAYKVLPAGTNITKLKMEDVEKDLTFLGLAGMVDPLREEVADAMKAAHAAHINVSIITGDFAITAEAIARQAGLAGIDQKIVVVSGAELRNLDDSQVLDLVTSGGVVFSRVSPEDKLRIVGLAKDSGKVVAVTGDGINDAPALKRADIGVAMGKTGTDVAKQSAEIILLDDSFKTLVGAVEQGRTIYKNIRKAALSCFTSNAAELIVNLVSLSAVIFFDVPLAITIMQILAIDMIAELFPIAALGWDKADGDVMHEKPRKLHDHILNPHSILDLLWCGVLIGGLAFGNFLAMFWRNGISASHANTVAPSIYVKATTITYLTIVVCQLLNILQRRSERGLFTRYQFHNKLLWLALGFSLFCVGNIIYNPVINSYFGAGPLSLTDWLYVLSAGAIFILFREIQHRGTKHANRDDVIEMYSSLVAK